MISTRVEPDLNSRMITSRVFWSMSPCVALTVKSRFCMAWVSQSTCGTHAGERAVRAGQQPSGSAVRLAAATHREAVLAERAAACQGKGARTLRRVLAKMTDWVMDSVSYRSHSVSSFQSSEPTFT